MSPASPTQHFRSTTPGKAAYFFYFAAAASLLPYITLYYEGLGFTGRQIGLLSGLVPLVTLLSASLWGMLADASRRHRLLLLVAEGGAWLGILTLSSVTSFRPMVLVVGVYAFFISPVIPLIDNAVVDLLGGDRNRYGRVRMWGAVGWGIVAVLSGAIVERAGLKWSFYSYLLFMIGLWITSLRLPISQAQLSGSIMRGFKLLLGNRRWTMFMFIVLLQGMSMSIFLNFLFLHMQKLGASRELMGLSLAISTASEIPLWFYSDRLLARGGPRPMLIFALLVFAVRAFAYGFMQAPWIVLPFSLLHGPSFSVMWAAGIAYVVDTAPRGMGATAQGLFSGTTFGIGGTLGGFIGGLLYERLGAGPTFIVLGISLLIGVIPFIRATARPE